jgi:hypothetical protein
MAGADSLLSLKLSPGQLGNLPIVYDLAQVLEREDLEDGSVLLTVKASQAAANRINQAIS